MYENKYLFTPAAFADKMILHLLLCLHLMDITVALLAPNMPLLTDSVYFYVYYANHQLPLSAQTALPAVPWIQNRGSMMEAVLAFLLKTLYC